MIRTKPRYIYPDWLNNDFMRDLGEWNQRRLSREAPTAQSRHHRCLEEKANPLACLVACRFIRHAFFRPGKRGKPQNSSGEVEHMLRPCRAKIAQIKRGIATPVAIPLFSNPSSAIPLPGVLLKPATPARVQVPRVLPHEL